METIIVRDCLISYYEWSVSRVRMEYGLGSIPETFHQLSSVLGMINLSDATDDDPRLFLF